MYKYTYNITTQQVKEINTTKQTKRHKQHTNKQVIITRLQASKPKHRNHYNAINAI